MRDVSPYGVTQNADAAGITANQLTGEVRGSTNANAIHGGPATFSTAPYIPPKRERAGMCAGKNNTCRAWPLIGTELCTFHTPRNSEPPTAP
jgi:hypothetical protein